VAGVLSANAVSDSYNIVSMPIKFPKRKSDGSFCVEITLLVNTNEIDNLAARITSWLDQWTKENRHWKWQGQLLDFFAEFTGSPTCVKRTPESLSLRVQGRPGSTKWWKDWIVLRLLKDLKGKFSELKAGGRFKDCPE